MGILKSIQDYWRIYVAILFVVAGTLFVSTSRGSSTSLLVQEQDLRGEIETLHVELNQKDLTEDDLQPEVEIIKESGAHARDMGEGMIEAQIELAKFYKNPEPISEHDDMDALAKAEAIHTRLTESTDYTNAWVLNHEWTMALDSIGTYSDVKNIPVVFSMYMENGDLAGVVRGKYDSDRDLLSDIIIDYTVSGYGDAIDPGGA